MSMCVDLRPGTPALTGVVSVLHARAAHVEAFDFAVHDGVLAGRLNDKGRRSWNTRDITAPSWCPWDPEATIPDEIAVLDSALADIDSYMAHIARRRATCRGGPETSRP